MTNGPWPTTGSAIGSPASSQDRVRRRLDSTAAPRPARSRITRSASRGGLAAVDRTLPLQHGEERRVALGRRRARSRPPAASRTSQTLDRRERLGRTAVRRRTRRRSRAPCRAVRQRRPTGMSRAQRAPGSAAAPSCRCAGRLTQSCTISSVPPRRVNRRRATPRARRREAAVIHCTSPGPMRAAVAGRVAVLDLALVDDRHGLEAAVRVLAHAARLRRRARSRPGRRSRAAGTG